MGRGMIVVNVLLGTALGILFLGFIGGENYREKLILLLGATLTAAFTVAMNIIYHV